MKTYFHLLIILVLSSYTFPDNISHQSYPILKRAEQTLRSALADIEPDLEVEYPTSSFSLIVNYKTQDFVIRPRSKTGAISEQTYNETGPSFRGFAMKCHLQPAGTINQAEIPQTIKEPYWQTDLNVTQVAGTDKQLYWALSYGSRTEKSLLTRIRKAMESLSNSEAISKEPLLAWQDSETEKIIFTSDDIVRFDWEKQKILLTLDGALNFKAWCVPHRHPARTFSIMQGTHEIAEGRWVSLCSSMSFTGPVYHQNGRLIEIANGYPGSISKTDSRYSNQLKTQLEQAGLLGKIDEDKVTENFKINIVHQPWQECANGIKVRVEYFPQTFRKKRDARAHIYFAMPPENKMPKIDNLKLHAKFTSPDKQFFNSMNEFSISPKFIEQGVYVYQFYPFSPSYDSFISEYFGSGKMQLRIDFQDEVKTTHHISFPEIEIPVNTQEKNGL
jgi:hypothetical protein